MFLVLLITVLNTFVCSQNTECETYIVGNGNHFYIFSENRTNAINAQIICSNSGGTLAEVNNDAMREMLFQLSMQLYVEPQKSIAGLVQVNIFSSVGNDDVSKYRPVNGVRAKDIEQIQGWNIPKKGRPKSFFLYKSPRNRFSTPMYFCYHQGRDLLENERCFVERGWMQNFVLYHAANESNETIAIYMYANQQNSLLSSAAYLRDDIRVDYLLLTGVTVHIPDISVIIGIRSDVGQSDWFWHNGTIASIGPDYPRPSASACEQMSWPLTYNDEINLRGKHCKDKAYFICQIPFEIQVLPLECNGSALIVEWKSLNLKEVTNNMENFNVKLKLKGENQVAVANYFLQKWMFGGLEKNTNYTVEAIIQNSCGMKITTSARGTTFHETAPTVENARVVESFDNKTDDCKIEWKFDTSSFNVTNFMIFVVVENETIPIFVASHLLQFFAPNLARYEINLTSISVETVVKFQIQALTCQKGSEVRNVSGECVVGAQSDETGNKSAYLVTVVSITSVLVIVGTILSVLAYHERKKASNRSSVNSDARNTYFSEPEAFFGYQEIIAKPKDCAKISSEMILDPADPKNSVSVYENEVAVRKANSIYENRTNDAFSSTTDEHVYASV